MKFIDKFMLSAQRSVHLVPQGGKILGAFEQHGSLWIHVEMLPSDMTQAFRHTEFFVLQAQMEVPSRAEHISSLVSVTGAVYHVYARSQ